MNGFVVLLRTNLDDFPVRLCETKDEAVKFGKRLRANQIRKLAAMFGVDPAGACNVAVVAFSAGAPVELHLVKELL